MGISELLVALLAIFAAAKLFGEIAERIGQPAVLGEMVGGIVIGVSGLHLIDAHDPLLHVSPPSPSGGAIHGVVRTP